MRRSHRRHRREGRCSSCSTGPTSSSSRSTTAATGIATTTCSPTCCRARLLDEQPRQIDELHLRASDWFDRNDEPGEAIRARDGRPSPRSGGAADRGGGADASADAVRKRRCDAGSSRFPSRSIDDRPVLSLALVGARMATGDASGVDRLLDNAERWVGSPVAPSGGDAPIVFDLDEFAGLPAQIAVFRAGARAARRRHRRHHHPRDLRPRAGRPVGPLPPRRGLGPHRTRPLVTRRPRRSEPSLLRRDRTSPHRRLHQRRARLLARTRRPPDRAGPAACTHAAPTSRRCGLRAITPCCAVPPTCTSD